VTSAIEPSLQGTWNGRLIRAADTTGVAEAVACLCQQGVVAIPTETSYGLAADGTSHEAVSRVARIKGRALGQPISLIIADRAMLGGIVHGIRDARVEALMEQHWPGPLTLVLPARTDRLSPLLLNEWGGVAVRVSSDAIASRLSAAVGFPLTATSANRVGELAACTAQQADLPGVDLVLDDGARSASPSTIVELRRGVLRVLREGPVRLPWER
jgi:L-threonylcarbamoyladenylate synthase